jgi:chorismate mutase/prephenate dehydratase
MTQSDPATPEISPELIEFRRQIDELDEKIAILLLERTEVVANVGRFKNKTTPGQCPIRAGREADQIRRIIKRFENTNFPPAAAAAIWRTLIGASTAVESPLSLSVFTPDRDNDLYWLAREYFGPFIPAARQPQVKRVIGDVMDGKAAVGIIPMLHSADTTYWWTNLMEQGSDIPKIFARIPFVLPDVPERNAPSAHAIARITPEPSGSDHSLLVMEADHNVSQNKLQTAFASARLEATWLNIATLNPASRHHLIEIKGFVLPEHPIIQSLLAGLSNSIFKVNFLGTYAVPVTLKGA